MSQCKCNCNCGCKKSRKIQIVQRPSPNFNDRRGKSVEHLILHYTAMNTAESAIDWLCDPKSQVSAHYVVAEDGTVTQLVSEDKRAWHAGVSYWAGATDINSSSVGIEIANQGDRPYQRAQMDAVIALSQSIVSRHGIPAHNVIGHSDVAPTRKQDPGQFFDWKGLAAAGLGVWPVPLQQDYEHTAGWGTKVLRQVLNQYGYSPEPEDIAIVIAFQRHFQPEVFNTPENIGIADKETMARAACLMRRREAAAAKAKTHCCKRCGKHH
jgi:N-acetylmuramoyl-L-alanine amidase